MFSQVSYLVSINTPDNLKITMRWSGLLTLLLINSYCTIVVSKIWRGIDECPKVCKCQEEHLQDLAIYRQTKPTVKYVSTGPKDFLVTNDVIDAEEESEINDNNPLLKVAICLLQTETDPKSFLKDISTEIQALILIQGSQSGKKSFIMSAFQYFQELIVLEMQGAQLVNNDTNVDKITLLIDRPITTLKYLNLNNIHVKNMKENEHLKTENEEVFIFQEKKNGDLETVMMEKPKQDEILPYNVYIQKQKNLETPVFAGFTNLVLLRLSSCDLQFIYWEMFEGLQNLYHLILENNNLRFIPDFAFYGTQNLKTLSLAWNNLLNIQITDLAGLLELEYLDLSHNNFSQLSELSFPPFPKLKLADFSNNPITIVYPNTFEVMNTTDSIILGGEDILLELKSNSFLGLNKLSKLTVNNVNIPLLQRELLVGMPVLKELTMTGQINQIEFDAFLEVKTLEKLILSNCNIYNLSMDSFYGLNNLHILDLSSNNLEFMAPGMFDEQTNLKELYLNKNQLTDIPSNAFKNIPVKLVRLNENPWHCTCGMMEWNSMQTNIVKQNTYTVCNLKDKEVTCKFERSFKYVYENKVSPKCLTPNKVNGIGVYQALRKYLHCNIHPPKVIKNNNAMYQKNIINSEIKTDIKESITTIKPTVINDKQTTTMNNEPNDLNFSFKSVHMNENYMNNPKDNNLAQNVLDKQQRNLKFQTKLNKLKMKKYPY